jgi:hypothetical protein
MRKKVIEKLQQEPNTLKEVRSLTFKPRICKKSDQIASQMTDVGVCETSEGRSSKKSASRTDC